MKSAYFPFIATVKNNAGEDIKIIGRSNQGMLTKNLFLFGLNTTPIEIDPQRVKSNYKLPCFKDVCNAITFAFLKKDVEDFKNGAEIKNKDNNPDIFVIENVFVETGELKAMYHLFPGGKTEVRPFEDFVTLQNC